MSTDSQLQHIQIRQGPLKLLIDPNVGARIVEFSLNGRNALFEGLPEWGSTFWPSPQHAWGWPPPPVLDNLAYDIHQSKDELSFSSKPCPITGIVLHKKIKAITKGFEVTYRMVNTSQRPVTFAPWEITRVGGGITFFAGSEPTLDHSTLALANTETCGRKIFWHDYQVATQQENLKSFNNGSEGWLANAYNGLLLLKRFPSIPAAQIAPQEAEIEIYAHGDIGQPYIEVEQQGAYTAMAPGEETAWTVQWMLMEIPQQVSVTVGSTELVQWLIKMME